MHKATHTLNAICSNDWAITEDALAIIVSVAMRENEPIEAVEKRLGRPLDNAHTVTVRDGIATIPVMGPIFRYANLFTMISGGTTIDALAQDLETTMRDPAIHSVALYIDSPGGDINGVNEFAAMVRAATAQKPVVAYIAHLGASAAYWIASAASEIVVDATAVVGSIGVVTAVRSPGASSSAKDNITFVSSQSPHKRPDPTTEGGRSRIQTHVDDLADVFVQAVARYRGVSTDKVLADFGQGDVLVGQHAVDAGLADRVGSYEQVLGELSAAPSLPSRSRAAAGALLIPVTATKEQAMSDPQETTAAAQAVDRSEIEALKAQIRAEQRRRIEVEAGAFVEAAITASRIFPAARQALVDLYAQAAQDDIERPLIAAPSAAAAGPASRVALIQAVVAAQPPHRLTDERVPPDQDARTLFNTTTQSADYATERTSAVEFARRANGKK